MTCSCKIFSPQWPHSVKEPRCVYIIALCNLFKCTSITEQYSDAVSICNDVVHTLCSTERVATLQRDANDATPAALRRVETWSKAVRAAVDRLQSEEFSPLADVVKPFTTGLLQVKLPVE